MQQNFPTGATMPCWYTPDMTILELGASVLQRIRSEAEARYPEEACGLLLGREQGQVLEALAMANQAEDRRRAYLIDPEQHLRTELRARERGLTVIGVWHSHPDGRPVPSVTDTESAWPDWHYVIAAVEAGQAREIRAWMLRESRFEEEVIHP